jgi:synaptobrevin family protein YKT6
VTLFSLQHKTIESVLERGTKLDDLVDRSQALSSSTRVFYKTAKKVCLYYNNGIYIARLIFPFTMTAKFLLRGYVVPLRLDFTLLYRYHL